MRQQLGSLLQLDHYLLDFPALAVNHLPVGCLTPPQFSNFFLNAKTPFPNLLNDCLVLIFIPHPAIVGTLPRYCRMHIQQLHLQLLVFAFNHHTPLEYCTAQVVVFSGSWKLCPSQRIREVFEAHFCEEDEEMQLILLREGVDSLEKDPTLPVWSVWARGGLSVSGVHIGNL